MHRVTKALAAAVIGLVGYSAQAETVYNSIPAPYPGNLPSLGYQATSTQEFGDDILLGGTSRNLQSVTIALSSWANQQSNPGVGDSTGYDYPITLNLYNAGDASGPGSLIATKTVTAHILWHTPNGFNGTLFNVDFDFSADGITLPDELVYGVAFNTQTHGYNPTGVSGPANSLNFGLAEVAPTVGTDVDPDKVYWNTSYAGFYSDGGAGGVNTFRVDTGWTGYTPAIQINTSAVPLPASAWAGLGLLGLLAAGKRVTARRA